MLKKIFLLSIAFSSIMTIPSEFEMQPKSPESSVTEQTSQNPKQWSKPRQLYKQFIDWKNTLTNIQNPNHPYNRFLNFRNSLFDRYHNFMQKKLTHTQTSQIKLRAENDQRTSTTKSHEPSQTKQTFQAIPIDQEPLPKSPVQAIPIYQGVVKSEPIAPTTLEPQREPVAFEQIKVPVLQQDSATPWKTSEVDLESHEQTVLGTPRLLWKDVRMQDGNNCGYHALKNILIMLNSSLSAEQLNIQLQDPNSTINRQLTSLPDFVNYIGSWAQKIHNTRKQILLKNLGLQEPYPDNFKELRSSLGYTFMKGLVDSNTGHVKINDLFANEVENLVENQSQTLQNNIVVLDGLSNLGKTKKGKEYLKRIQQFKEAKDGRLGILWTEPGFNHWVGYFAIKEDGKVTLYYLNSTNHANPRQTQELINMLKP